MNYLIVTIICVVALLVAFNKVNKFLPGILYVCGAALILMNTLPSAYLVGSDIHMESYYAQLAVGQDVRPLAYAVPQGTSIVNRLIVPSMPWPIIWSYKLVLPLIFALTAPLVYWIARKWLTPRRAFLATCVFVFFTPFFTEVPTIARQMVAEVALFCLIGVILRMQGVKRYWLLIPLGGLLVLSHYSMMIVAIIVLLTGFIVSSIIRKYRLAIGIALITVIVIAGLYYPFVEDGAVVRTLGHLYNHYAPTSLKLQHPIFALQDLEAYQETSKEEGPNPPLPTLTEKKPFYARYDTLTAAALGADFFQTNWLGKLFRVSQWLLLIVGLIGVYRLRRKRTYWVVGVGFILITALCIVPGWASILNITRYLHLTLAILGVAIATTLRPRVLAGMLAVYLLITSGLIFEATRQPTIERITAPYSVAFSGTRFDIGASTTSDDIAVRDYIYQNQLYPIYADINGTYLMIEKVGPLNPRDEINRSLPKRPDEQELSGYLFLRSRNVQDGTFCVWSDVGLRRFAPIGEYLPPNVSVIYQVGDAQVLQIKE